MATSMALARFVLVSRNLRKMAPVLSAHLFKPLDGSSKTCRTDQGVSQLLSRQYSNKTLEGMGEYVEDEEPLDTSLLNEPIFPRGPRPEEQAWRQTRKWHAKQYARFGKASGVNPAIIWPTKAELKTLIEEENQYFPSLQEMQAELAAEKEAADIERLKREKLIASNMAKMPKMIDDYWKQRGEERAKQQEQKNKRARLLEMAKDKLGYAVDPRSPRFKQMVEEVEAEEKKRRKELKKKGIKV